MMNANQMKVSAFLAELVLAVKDANMAKTVELVNQMNELDVLTTEFDLQAVLSPNIFYNDCAVYAITNLNNVGRREEMLLIQRINQLYSTENKEDIDAFLDEFGTVEQLKELEMYQISRLYQLCIDFELWDDLAELRDIFNSVKGE